MALVFTTLDKVRSEAGFTNNSNISDSYDIEPHAYHADGEALAYIAQKYVIPLSENIYWDDSPAKYMLEGVVTNWSAGLLMMKQYEGQGGLQEEKAKAKIDRVKEHMKMIADGRFRLIGSNGLELTLLDSDGTINGLPNTNEDDYKAKISINDAF